MLYNYGYKLPIIKSTYKSDYGKGRSDIISHDVEYYDLKKYSLKMINKSINVYAELIDKLHKISISCLINIDEKNVLYRQNILETLNIILDNKVLNELDIITIEHYFKDRKEKLEIVRDSKNFDKEMETIAESLKKNKKKNQSSSKSSAISTFKADAILDNVVIENV